MRLFKPFPGGFSVRWLNPRLGIFNLNFVGLSLQVAQSGEQGWPEAVEEEELELDELDEVVPLVMVVDGVDVPCDSCDFELLSSSGSLGFSELPGTLGSVGSLRDPLPPTSPPPPGGQKGHIHEGP